MGSVVNVASAGWRGTRLKVVGIFRTGNASYDENQTFVSLKRAQEPAGSVQPDQPLHHPARRSLRRPRCRRYHRSGTGYKSVSWLEAAEDLMSVLLVRNMIMYSVVSAILVVAAFGIYNTISTIVMEKTHDIAILKSMGFHARDVRRIFLAEGVILGAIGSLAWACCWAWA
jgi:lipoprotein-releasing system permease protein